MKIPNFKLLNGKCKHKHKKFIGDVLQIFFFNYKAFFLALFTFLKKIMNNGLEQCDYNEKENNIFKKSDVSCKKRVELILYNYFDQLAIFL